MVSKIGVAGNLAHLTTGLSAVRRVNQMSLAEIVQRYVQNLARTKTAGYFPVASVGAGETPLVAGAAAGLGSLPPKLTT